MLYIMLDYLMLFAALHIAVCLHNAYFYAIGFFKCFYFHTLSWVFWHIACLFQILSCIMHSAFNLSKRDSFSVIALKIESLRCNWARMAVEVSVEARSMTSYFITKLIFSRKELVHMVSRRTTVSSRPRLTNSDFDGFRRRPMSASNLEHIFMLLHTDLGSHAIVASSKYTKTLRLHFMEEATSWIVRGNRSWPRRSPCCTPVAGQINFPLAMREDGEPYANDTSQKISEQSIMYMRRWASRRVELKAFIMSSFART